MRAGSPRGRASSRALRRASCGGCARFAISGAAAHFSLTVYAPYTRGMRLLVVGNHACSNRGDAAILRGLLAGLHARAPEASLDVVSRYPVSAAYVLARPIE